MRILGIDPGYAIVGWGVIEHQGNHFRTLDYGAITTNAGGEFTARLETIYRDICRLLQAAKPDAMAIEKLFFNTNTTTAIDVAQARGVILLAAKQRDIPVFEYTPLQVKQAVTGYGRAEKKQIQAMVKTFLGLKSIPRPDDAADALAVALTHAQTNKLGGLFKI